MEADVRSSPRHYNPGGRALVATSGVEVRHVAEVLASMTDEVPPIGALREVTSGASSK